MNLRSNIKIEIIIWLSRYGIVFRGDSWNVLYMVWEVKAMIWR